MPPKKGKQPVSNRSSADAPAPNPTTQTPPQNSPPKQPTAAGITQAQKQALIDNLQLEVTERARKLRAQYADHAAHLKTRLESRVLRIPQGLRKRKMGDLLDEFTRKERPAEPPAPQAISVHRGEEEEQAGRTVRGVKRASDEISADGAGEKTGGNIRVVTAEAEKQDLENPKKRVKTTTTTKSTTTTIQQANTKASRSKNAPAATTASSVLSPKSHNSRTLPRSPFKAAGGSPEKPSISLVRPASPAKPAATTGRAGAGARTASRQQTTTRKAATTAAAASENERSSGVSDSSAGTTIVKKAAPKARAAAVKKQPAAATKTTASAAAKKATAVTAGRKENVAPSATTTAGVGGGRSLRSKRT